MDAQSKAEIKSEIWVSQALITHHNSSSHNTKRNTNNREGQTNESNMKR